MIKLRLQRLGDLWIAPQEQRDPPTRYLLQHGLH